MHMCVCVCVHVCVCTYVRMYIRVHTAHCWDNMSTYTQFSRDAITADDSMQQGSFHFHYAPFNNRVKQTPSFMSSSPISGYSNSKTKR